ncbi:hypothetical protein Tco_1449932 [Tanacetum coccineum]
MELYMQNREHGRMILESVENGPLIWPTVEENGVTRTKKYAELSVAEKIQAACDINATISFFKTNNMIPQVHSPQSYSPMYPPTYPSQPQFNHSSVPPSHPYQSQMVHQTSSVPKIAYQSPQASTQPMTELPLVDSGLVVSVFSLSDDPTACLNKAMAFLTAVASSRGDKGKVILVLVIKGMLLVLGETIQVDRQGLLNATTVKDRAMLAEAQEAGQILDEEQLVFLADPGIPDGQAIQKIIPNNPAFQTEDLDAYDSDCDDVSNAKVKTQQAAVQDTNLQAQQDSMILFVIEQMSEQMINHALGYQNPFYLKKAQRIKPTLYDRSVISSKHVAMPVIDNDETLILEEVIEVPSELPKVCLVNESLKKLKFYLAKFDSMVKKRTTPNALIEDVLLSVMKSVTLNGESMNVELQRSESCDKCFNLDAEFLVTQNAYNDLLKSYSQLEKHCISLELSIQLNQEIFQKDKSCDNQNAFELPEYFENNDSKAQLQDKDITICKLKEIIKSMRENTKEENVNYVKSEIQTINVELENSVVKLLSENKRLCKEINHVKQGFKDQFDSIKKTRVHTKEQSDSLIDKLNLKFVENKDLKAQIQDKVFVITSLKNDLRKLKGKEIVDSVAQIPSATTIVPCMFKLDLDPLAPRLLQNREAHIDYLKHTQEQADILRGIVEQAKAKQPLDNVLDFACKHAKRIQELLVYVRDTCPNAIKLSAKKVVVTPINKVKKVRFSEPLTSSSNIKQSVLSLHLIERRDEMRKIRLDHLKQD